MSVETVRIVESLPALRIHPDQTVGGPSKQIPFRFFGDQAPQLTPNDQRLNSQGLPPVADSFAARLNQLFEDQRAPSGKPWTNVDVAKALAELGSPATPAYVSQLRNGKRDNPTLAYVRAVAVVFGVSASYFVVDAAAAAASSHEHALVAVMNGAGIVSRLKGLDDQSLEPVEVLVDEVRKLKGYPRISK